MAHNSHTSGGLLALNSHTSGGLETRGYWDDTEVIHTHDNYIMIIT